ncbi:hypothetical protein EO244_08000 [Ancylomarina salipaludis]|uniref:DUF5689 domain-containing protein n=1 Tax=Ancylomarina salipaludis TaxID=2501299 RepID=A0A4V1N056_9BACT|nr:DUF5689 domain-containing protein [Ancylomarina salipaludis]RXQ94985.1 hypothetical protein EO244_08000 [Ancylomarina salipaludis]
MKKISLYIIAALLGLLFFNSCDEEDYAEPTFVEPVFEMPADASLISIEELKAIYTSKIGSTGKYLNADDFMTVEDDIYISGYVISDDKAGNFYKTLIIQSDLTGNEQGISISIGESSLYTKYAIGQKIYVKCKGLTLGKYGNEVQLGGSFYFYKPRDNQKEYRLAPIPSPSVDAHIFNDKYPVNIVPAVRNIEDVAYDVFYDSFNTPKAKLKNENYKFTLMTFKDVQFVKPNQTWGLLGDDHNPDFPFKTTIEIIDNNGKKLPLFNSNYSKFAHLLTPSGKFNITGVLSVHEGYAQFVINSLDDLEMLD